MRKFGNNNNNNNNNNNSNSEILYDHGGFGLQSYLKNSNQS
jgi:hypothetical protein